MGFHTSLNVSNFAAEKETEKKIKQNYGTNKSER